MRLLQDCDSFRVRDQSRMSIKKLAPVSHAAAILRTAAWGIVRDPNLALDYADEALAEDAPGFTSPLASCVSTASACFFSSRV
jgi:hypothetical protein